MTVKELREKRARLITQARAKHDEIKGDTTDARQAEIATEFDAIITEADGLEARAVSLERLESAENSLTLGDTRAPRGDEGEQRGVIVPEAVAYRSAFFELMKAGGDVHAVSNEVRAALAEGNKETRAQTAGTDAEGGHIVPAEMMAQIVIAMAAWGPMYSAGFGTDIQTAGGGSLPIPGVDNTAFRAAKQAIEGAALADTGAQDRVFTKKTLEDYLYPTDWLRLSLQLLTGGMGNMESLFGGMLGEQLGRTANDVLTIGSGVSEPQGIVTGAGVGFTPAGVASITSDDLMELVHKIDPAYRASPKFGMMFNDTTLLALHKLKDGQGNYLLGKDPTQAGTLQIGAVTAKYTVNQAMPDMAASARSIVVGDMGKYFVRKIGSVVIGTDKSAQFWPGMGMAGFTRLDGVVADTRAIKALVHPAA